MITEKESLLKPKQDDITIDVSVHYNNTKTYGSSAVVFFSGLLVGFIGLLVLTIGIIVKSIEGYNVVVLPNSFGVETFGFILIRTGGGLNMLGMLISVISYTIDSDDVRALLKTNLGASDFFGILMFLSGVIMGLTGMVIGAVGLLIGAAEGLHMAISGIVLYIGGFMLIKLETEIINSLV